MDATAILERILDEPRVARVRAVLDIYGRAAGGLLANGLAFAALFAAIPTMILVLGLAGFIAAGNPEITDRVAEALTHAFPPLADLIQGSLDALSQGAAITSILGVIGLVWTVSQLYGALDVAFARIFADAPERDIVRRTARGLLVVVLLGGLVVAFVVLASLSTILDAMSAQVPAASTMSTILGSVPFLIVVAIVAVVVAYRALPPRAPTWRAIILPAIVIGLAVVTLSQVFMFLVPRLVGVAALAGSLASAFIALAWLSFTFQALLYGAAWVRVRDEMAKAGGSAALERAAAAAEPGAGGQ